MNEKEFYELRRDKGSKSSSSVVTFCLLETRQCMIEGDSRRSQRSKYSHPAGSSINSAIFEDFSKFCLDMFQCSNAKSMEISCFNMCRISQLLNHVNSYIKLHVLVSRSELCGHIKNFQLLNGLKIREILRVSINSDSKFGLPNVF